MLWALYLIGACWWLYAFGISFYEEGKEPLSPWVRRWGPLLILLLAATWPVWFTFIAICALLFYAGP
jgi:hypothetical protein